jgi:hypothetical protein
MLPIAKNASLVWFMTMLKRNASAFLEPTHSRTVVWLVMPFVEPVQALQAVNVQTV